MLVGVPVYVAVTVTVGGPVEVPLVVSVVTAIDRVVAARAYPTVTSSGSALRAIETADVTDTRTTSAASMISQPRSSKISSAVRRRGAGQPRALGATDGGGGIEPGVGGEPTQGRLKRAGEDPIVHNHELELDRGVDVIADLSYQSDPGRER